MENKDIGANKPAAEEAKKTVDVIETITDLYASGIDRLAEIQKKGLEVAVRHNAEVVGAWKKLSLAAPAVLMLDLATNAFERMADTQKGVIDLIVEQSHTFAKTIREREVKTIDNLEEGKARAKEAIEHTVAAQKTALDFTAKQAKAAFETAKHQFGYAGTPAGVAAESIERGIEVVVEAQKELLDEVVASTLH